VRLLATYLLFESECADELLDALNIHFNILRRYFYEIPSYVMILLYGAILGFVWSIKQGELLFAPTKLFVPDSQSLPVLRPTVVLILGRIFQKLD